MKAAFIHDQIEYKLEVAKEGMRQGDCLPCTLTLKNHAEVARSLPALRFELACGDIKAVREKKDAAFEVLASAQFAPPMELAPQQQCQFPWECQLDRNCPVSDKAQTLYLLYGCDAGALGQQPLSVLPHEHIEVILRILETSFQFVLKGQKWAKGWVDAKFKPPSSRRFSLLNELVLGFRSEGNELLLRFNFNEKTFDATTAITSVKKKKTQLERRIPESRYVLAGGYLNHELIESEISAALDTVAFKL